jgi:hypothetical protein
VRTGSRPESGSSKDDVRIQDERAREPRPLAHPARELVRHLVRGPRQPDLPEAAGHDLPDLVLALVGVLAEREGDVVEHVHGAEEGAVLEQDPELLAHLEQLVVGHVRHRLTVHEHVALVRIQQADHVLDADGLPRPRGAEDHRDLVLGDAEVEAVQDRGAAEGLRHVDELDRVGRAVVALRARVPAVGCSPSRVGA